MTIDWDALELRDQPSAADIAKAVKQALDLPDAGDHEHVQAQFPIYGKGLPAIPQGTWDQAKQKTVKLSKLQATNAQLDRQNLIWHLKSPGKSRFRGLHNTHPQILKIKGDLVIIDGHHRLSALKMLGLDKEMTWRLTQ